MTSRDVVIFVGTRLNVVACTQSKVSDGLPQEQLHFIACFTGWLFMLGDTVEDS